MSKKFIKCDECKEKPATVKCMHCFNSSQNSCKIYCYNCDRIEHQTSEKKKHKKQLIPYQEMIQEYQQDVSLSPPQIENNSNSSNKVQHVTFNEEIKDQIQNDIPLQSVSPTKVEDSVNNFKLNVSNSHSLKNSSTKKSSAVDSQVYTRISSIKKKLQENNFNEFLQNSQILKNYREQSQDDEYVKSLNQLKEQEIRNVEMKYKIKFQSQENMITLLKNKIEQVESRYQENIEQIQLENNQLINKLQEQCSVLQQELEQERKAQQDKIQINKEEQTRNEEYTQIKISEIMRENEILMGNIKDEYENSINDLKQTIDKKNDIIASNEKKLSQLVIEQQQKDDLIEKQDNDIKGLKEITEHQQLDITRLKKITEEISKEVEIFQREAELELEEKIRLKEESQKLEQKVIRYEKMIYGTKKSIKL